MREPRIHLSQRICQGDRQACLFTIDYDDGQGVDALVTLQADMHGQKLRIVTMFEGGSTKNPTAYDRASAAYDKAQKSILDEADELTKRQRA
jgi:hypothetical protein